MFMASFLAPVELRARRSGELVSRRTANQNRDARTCCVGPRHRSPAQRRWPMLARQRALGSRSSSGQYPACYTSEDALDAIGLARTCLHQRAFAPPVASMSAALIDEGRPSTRGPHRRRLGAASDQTGFYTSSTRPECTGQASHLERRLEFLASAICACRYSHTLE